MITQDVTPAIGSPARAGIDPDVVSVCEDATRFPARAGIDPPKAMLIGLSPRFPRTRGDRPFGFGIASGFGVVPPHARG